MLSIFGMLLLTLVGFLLVCVVLALLVTWIGVSYQRRKNQKEPVRTVNATVVSKREKPIYRKENPNAKNNSIIKIIYYVTFALEGDNTKELSVTEEEYAVLREGQTGKLSFQGDWYDGFEQIRESAICQESSYMK